MYTFWTFNLRLVDFWQHWNEMCVHVCKAQFLTSCWLSFSGWKCDWIHKGKGTKTQTLVNVKKILINYLLFSCVATYLRSGEEGSWSLQHFCYVWTELVKLNICKVSYNNSTLVMLVFRTVIISNSTVRGQHIALLVVYHIRGMVCMWSLHNMLCINICTYGIEFLLTFM